jgi:hypothetical protein
MSNDLPAATLTNAQRAYLRGEREYNSAHEREIRTRIRERYYASLLDFSLLARECSVEDLDTALETGRPDEAPDDPQELAYPEGALEDLVTLIYLAHRDVEQEGESSDGWRTAMDVENGIKTALVDRLGVDAEVSVEIEVERRDALSALADETDDLADLSGEQLTDLLRAGEITGDDHARAWVRKQERGDFGANSEE